MTTDERVSTHLWQLGATRLAAAIRSREVSAREVVEAHLRRIDTVNPVLNAVVARWDDQALAAADAADRAALAGGDLPPFHGVPFTVKGNIDLVGTPTTQGARALADVYPTRDAPVVERLRTAGGIPIGRTNLPTYALRWHTDSELWGETVNPWDASRTPGASSGGEAVAVATGMSPLGLGNDTLGSLRWPAQCCGVAALKPSLGRVPDASSVGPGDWPIGVQLTSVQGPLARHVGDLRAALAVLAGASWRDPWSVPAPLEGPRLPGPVHVAIVPDPAGLGTASSVRDGVRLAGTLLADRGYAVDELEPPELLRAGTLLLDLLGPGDAPPEAMEGQFPALPDKARRFLAQYAEVAGRQSTVPGTAYPTRSGLARAWGEFQEHHPLVVAPICTQPPFLAGSDLDDGAVARTVRDMRMAMAVNALGLPAVAVPVGVADGLPQVVQVIGPRFREDLCLDAAEQLEEAVGTITPIDPR